MFDNFFPRQKQRHYWFVVLGTLMSCCLTPHAHALHKDLADEKAYKITDTEYLAAVQKEKKLADANKALNAEITAVTQTKDALEIEVSHLREENSTLRNALKAVQSQATVGAPQITADQGPAVMRLEAPSSNTALSLSEAAASTPQTQLRNMSVSRSNEISLQGFDPKDPPSKPSLQNPQHPVSDIAPLGAVLRNVPEPIVVRVPVYIERRHPPEAPVMLVAQPALFVPAGIPQEAIEPREDVREDTIDLIEDLPPLPGIVELTPVIREEGTNTEAGYQLTVAQAEPLESADTPAGSEDVLPTEVRAELPSPPTDGGGEGTEEASTPPLLTIAAPVTAVIDQHHSGLIMPATGVENLESAREEDGILQTSLGRFNGIVGDLYAAVSAAIQRPHPNGNEEGNVIAAPAQTDTSTEPAAIRLSTPPRDDEGEEQNISASTGGEETPPTDLPPLLEHTAPVSQGHSIEIGRLRNENEALRAALLELQVEHMGRGDNWREEDALEKDALQARLGDMTLELEENLREREALFEQLTATTHQNGNFSAIISKLREQLEKAKEKKRHYKQFHQKVSNELQSMKRVNKTPIPKDEKDEGDVYQGYSPRRSLGNNALSPQRLREFSPRGSTGQTEIERYKKESEDVGENYLILKSDFDKLKKETLPSLRHKIVKLEKERESYKELSEAQAHTIGEYAKTHLALKQSKKALIKERDGLIEEKQSLRKAEERLEEFKECFNAIFSLTSRLDSENLSIHTLPRSVPKEIEGNMQELFLIQKSFKEKYQALIEENESLLEENESLHRKVIAVENDSRELIGSVTRYKLWLEEQQENPDSAPPSPATIIRSGGEGGEENEN